jgi:predicted RND superfamily exporter protein
VISPSARIGGHLERHASLLIAAAALLTAMLVIPMLLLAPDEIASTEPGGEVFDLRDEIDEKLRSGIFPTAYIAEARDGDILTQAALSELLDNERALREADRRGELTPDGLTPLPLLVDSFDRDTGVTFTGVISIADAVAAFLPLVLGTSLDDASDDQVKLAVAMLLDDPRTSTLADQLSVEATSVRRDVLGREIDYWVAPAVLFIVLADNEALGGASRFRGIASDEAILNLERFARKVQRELRGDASTYRLWGIAIDQNLSAREQGQAAGTFILLTVIAALSVVGLSLRGYWPTALTAIGVGTLMIWLKGLTALVGIKGGLIVELIVPIAMVSLGVDFAVHAVRRYREERAAGLAPSRALRVGMAGVLGALVLAMLSDGIAFLSNVPSGIEAIVHFGVAAGIAVFSSFIVLGIVLPVALMRIDSLCEASGEAGVRRARWQPLAGGAGVTAMTGVGVILLIAVDQAIGAAVLALAALLFLGVPIAVLLRRGSAAEQAPATAAPPDGPSRTTRWVVSLVVGVGARPAIVLPLAAIITAASIVLALRLEATFDVKDFFSNDSDIVVSLDKLDQHVGDRSGEGAIVFVRGDLTSPATIRAVDAFIAGLRDNPYVGRDAAGEPSVFERNVLGFLRLVMGNDLALARVEAMTGVRPADADGDGYPDTAAQALAIFDFVTAAGVPLDETTDIYTADQVGTALHLDPSSPGELIATFFVGLPGTREQSVVREAKQALLADIEPLADAPGITQVGLTGSPFVRDAELTATVDNLRRSLPIAAIGALVLLLVAMRSVRYAVVTVVPIGLVVAWLYAIMELAGLALNFVSATIGAVSIGVGIDFSIHMTVRFREELARAASRLDALTRAAAGTGTALLASAGSSIVGFAIMGFAPMPMFSTYGMLTALMIFLALAAALVVLPALLMLVTPEHAAAAREAEES